MDQDKYSSIISVLMRSELTSLENQFLGRIREYYETNNTLTEQQESILEGIYREKTRGLKRGVQREAAYAVRRAV